MADGVAAIKHALEVAYAGPPSQSRWIPFPKLAAAIEGLLGEILPVDTFIQAGDQLALRFDGRRYHRANYERGILLYGLARLLGARRIIEVGTGRGLGSFAGMLAGAHVDTIDITHPNAPVEAWRVVDGEAITTKERPSELLRTVSSALGATGTVRHHQGTSLAVIGDLLGQRTDIVFLDGAHHYAAVAAELHVLAGSGALLLLDDYSRSEFGVRRAAEERLAPPINVIVTDRTLIPDLDGRRRSGDGEDYGMVVALPGQLKRANAVHAVLAVVLKSLARSYPATRLALRISARLFGC